MREISAFVERDLRKFLRSPALIVASVVFPLIQLIVLGYAFGGKVRNARLAVVDQDHGPEALRVKEMLYAVEANARTFRTHFLPDDREALRRLRDGEFAAVLHIPPHFSRRVHSDLEPRLALVIDNTDPFVAGELQARLGEMVRGLGGFQSMVGPWGKKEKEDGVRLDTVELYGYIEYIEYLLPGSVVLAIFVSAMIGGGIIFIDDKARGLHEGYLVTPVSRLSLIGGFILAGTVKGIISGLALTLMGSVAAGVNLGRLLSPSSLGLLLTTIALTSLALISMMFLLMARVEDPLVPRAVVGILNTLLYFPSGAVYPIEGFPRWLRVLSVINPETYAVHAFKGILLKGVGLGPVLQDYLFLGLFSLAMMAASIWVFKRTL